MMGHNLYQEEWKNENVQAQNLVVDGLYTYTNAKSTTPVNYYEKKRLVGLYGDISLGYKDMLFVNVTGRNDWSSTLPINNRSYFYPSISGSFIFTEVMLMWVVMKIRTIWHLNILPLVLTFCNIWVMLTLSPIWD